MGKAMAVDQLDKSPLRVGFSTSESNSQDRGEGHPQSKRPCDERHAPDQVPGQIDPGTQTGDDGAESGSNSPW
jgi:hypothetical protein